MKARVQEIQKWYLIVKVKVENVKPVRCSYNTRLALWDCIIIQMNMKQYDLEKKHSQHKKYDGKCMNRNK